ncbi:MAG: radical SAM protein [Fibrobacter sp.]|nr:radical SAM protein [Fibrobacter sp.]
MKICFLNPPFHPMFSRESRSPSVTKSSTLYWPMFLAYAAGCTEADGNEIQLLDSPAMELDLEQTLAKMAEFEPQAVVVNVSTPSILNDLEVVHAIKQRFAVPIAIMGTHATAEPLESLEMMESLDFCIIGEADFTVRELVRHWRGDGVKQLDMIAGIAWRENGQPRRTAEGAKIENLDELPWVSKIYKEHLFSCYKKYFYGANINPLIVILSGRGCPHRCTYCVVPQTITGHVYRKRSPKDVVDELEYIKDNFPELGEVFFEDDTFTVDPRHTRAICEEILQRKLKITWSANARADVSGDLLKLMKKAGNRELCVGFESASAEVLKSVKKGLKLDRAEQFMKDARAAGILIHGCFMVGNPSDTPETLQETLDYALKLNPNTAQFYPIMAYPGTEAYNEALASGALASRDYSQWLDKDGHHRTTIKRPGLSSQQLVDFCDLARRKFYLRPSYILKQGWMALIDKHERYRVWRGFKTLAQHLFKRHGELEHGRQAPTDKG